MYDDFTEDGGAKGLDPAKRRQIYAVVAILLGGSLVVSGMANGAGGAILALLIGLGLLYGGGRLLVEKRRTE
jgi:hypothetical protein